jgi:hypothetical protein
MSKAEYKCIKPNIVAIQFNGENTGEILEFCGKQAYDSGRLNIISRSYQCVCSKNDFVARNFDGEFYVISPETFKKSYQII